MRKRKRKQAHRPLTDQQKRAADLYFDHPSFPELAALVGVHRSTIWRWYQRSDFQREISRRCDYHARQHRRAWLKAYHNSPEYKEQQRRKYYARRKLKILAERLEAAGESGNMTSYRKASAAYDKCFNEAYFGGKTPLDVLNESRFLTDD